MPIEPGGPVRFSLFDHLDESGRGQGETYRERLKMVEVAEEAGFYCYHLAEHHGTELSTVPSPALFLAAVAERTSRIRLGPLTYLLPLYNPLRLMEEICILDQLSQGRLEIGLSRGSSPYEGLRFGVKREDSRDMFNEALELIIQGLTQGELNFQGRFYQYDHVMTRMTPAQKPYPPMWYPTTNIESVPWVAKHGFNTLFSYGISGSFEACRQMVDLYREEWNLHENDPDRMNGHVKEPFVGINGHVHVAATDELAREQARPAYAKYIYNFTERYNRVGDPKHAGKGNFDRDVDEGKILVGSPDTVRARIGEYIGATGANYFLGEFSFGSLPLDQITESIKLFASEVMPAFTREPATA
jgi:alkanesulfonate monooxygenase SsuD/methylene tetrahydromethanopterin reductase-like flavin-dependent oxidoreductase (luciferase family)